MSIVNIHAPLLCAKRLIRAKSSMTRSKLKNIFNKNPTIGNKTAYQKRNHCVKLLRQTKRNYYNTL